MDKSANTSGFGDLSNTLSASNVNIVESEVLGLVVSSSQVVNHIRVSNALLDLLVVPEIPLHGHNLSKIAHHFQMPLLVLITVRNDDLRTLLCKSVDKVSSEETSAAEDGNDVTRDRVTIKCNRRDEQNRSKSVISSKTYH